MPQFTWLTLQDALNALNGRLQNSGLWSQAELQVYITEALRFWSALTEDWPSDFIFTANSNTSTWNNLGTMTGSPRLRTVTDAYLYSQMQYMLMEPATGAGTWTGTNQFNLAAMQYALNNRRNQMIQSSACNLVNFSVATTPGTRRNAVPDSTLELRRIRFLGTVANTTATAVSGAVALTVVSTQGIGKGQVATASGVPSGAFVLSVIGQVVTISVPTTAGLAARAISFAYPVSLTREDTQAFQFFAPNYLQTDQFPASWSVASEPPLAFDVDNSPNVAGSYDVIGLQSGPTFAPPAASLLGVPDDWSWVAMYGALADLLNSEAERTDRTRAKYCQDRFNIGLQMMQQANWLVQANINDVPCDTPSVYETDWTSPFWQNNIGQFPKIVQAGMDLCAVAPTVSASVNLTLVGNAPITTLLTGYVQISRDAWDQVLNYAVHLAAWKEGGAEFQATMPLYTSFLKFAAQTNSRLLTYGFFTKMLHSEGERQEENVPRMTKETANG